MKKRTNFYLLILVAFALTLRLWGISTPATFMGDEGMLVPASGNYIKTGHVDPDHFYHPPLKYLLLQSCIRILGSNPYGWRMVSVLLGTMSVFILFLLTREFFDEKVAWLAATLLAVDPTHVMQSRVPAEEVYIVFFFLWGLFMTARYIKGDDRCLVWAGVFLGLTLATKLYFSLASLMLFLTVLFLKHKDKKLDWSSFLDISASLILLPLTIYVLSYYAWFGRGYDIFDFIRFQGDSYRELQTVTIDSYAMGKVADSNPTHWITKPLFYGFKYRTDGAWSEYHVDMTNFPIWILTIPSFLYLVLRIFKRPDRVWGLFAVSFASTYIPMIVIKRPMFIYSSITVLPFILVTVSFFLVSLLNRLACQERYFAFLKGAVVSWCLFLYPLVLGKAVPDVIYTPLLEIGRIYNLH